MPFRAVTVTPGGVELAGWNPRRRSLSLAVNTGGPINFSHDRANILASGLPLTTGQVVTLTREEGDEPELPVYADIAAGSADVRVQESVGLPVPLPVHETAPG